MKTYEDDYISFGIFGSEYRYSGAFVRARASVARRDEGPRSGRAHCARGRVKILF